MSSPVVTALVLLLNGSREPRAVHSQLPGHRANILKRDLRAVGIGHACTITVELFGGR